MSQKKILIVDDEESFTRLLKLNLEAGGTYRVRTENRAPHAVSAAKEFRPDLIFLDVMMPEMDGGDIASVLRADPEMKHIPIVFLTAAVKKEEVNSRGGEVGGFPYLAKPVDVETVIACLRTHLGR
jgi:two-component system, OmpR family, response regulator